MQNESASKLIHGPAKEKKKKARDAYTLNEMLFFPCFKRGAKSFPHLPPIVIATFLFINMNLIVLFDTIINS